MHFEILNQYKEVEIPNPPRRFYLYFLFVGYRLSIGKSSNLYSRLAMYRRTHFEIFPLGVIEYNNQKELNAAEKKVLTYFQEENAFRDMFYLSPKLFNWIINNTIPVTGELIKDTIAYKKAKRTKLEKNPYSKNSIKKFRDN